MISFTRYKMPFFQKTRLCLFVLLFSSAPCFSLPKQCAWFLESFDFKQAPTPVAGYIDTVVVALTNDNGQVLMASRGKESSHSGSFALLGGKVDPNETLEEALKRELLEEANITKIYNLKLQFVATSIDEQAPVGRDYRVFVFTAQMQDDWDFINLEPHKNEEMGWVSWQELASVFPPSRSYWSKLCELLAKF